MDFPTEFINLLRKTTRLVVLTGAGVSQESGLRTFRDAQTGLWAQYKPEDLASPEAFARDPKLVWDWYAWRREAVKGVRPNPGHYALIEMEKRVTEFTLITQNVDGLHRFAGSRNVLELHGNIQRVRCSQCGTFTEIWGDDSEAVPVCEICEGLLRPDVVWFGEALPRAELEAAAARVGRLVRNSDGRQSRRRSKRLTATAVPGVKDLRWRPEASPSFTSGPFPWLCRLCSGPPAFAVNPRWGYARQKFRKIRFRFVVCGPGTFLPASGALESAARCLGK